MTAWSGIVPDGASAIVPWWTAAAIGLSWAVLVVLLPLAAGTFERYRRRR
ncbi:MAG TPA: hypothetical protein VFD84_06645 [Candidatus Binatia bacterium]|jgi:hypothetical protein|nr:hypothetical protein [Candidatus Binatia bacterium]